MQNIAAAETLQTNDINIGIVRVAAQKAAMELDVTLPLLSGQKF